MSGDNPILDQTLIVAFSDVSPLMGPEHWALIVQKLTDDLFKLPSKQIANWYIERKWYFRGRGHIDVSCPEMSQWVSRHLGTFPCSQPHGKSTSNLKVFLKKDLAKVVQVKVHVPKSKDNISHMTVVANCLRLAQIPKDKVDQMVWAEVTRGRMVYMTMEYQMWTILYEHQTKYGGWSPGLAGPLKFQLQNEAHMDDPVKQCKISLEILV